MISCRHPSHRSAPITRLPLRASFAVACRLFWGRRWPVDVQALLQLLGQGAGHRARRAAPAAVVERRHRARRSGQRYPPAGRWLLDGLRLAVQVGSGRRVRAGSRVQVALLTGMRPLEQSAHSPRNHGDLSLNNRSTHRWKNRSST